MENTSLDPCDLHAWQEFHPQHQVHYIHNAANASAIWLIDTDSADSDLHEPLRRSSRLPCQRRYFFQVGGGRLAFIFPTSIQDLLWSFSFLYTHTNPKSDL